MKLHEILRITSHPTPYYRENIGYELQSVWSGDTDYPEDKSKTNRFGDYCYRIQPVLTVKKISTDLVFFRTEQKTILIHRNLITYNQ